jgi:trans-aconitate 2-methyltransferase
MPSWRPDQYLKFAAERTQPCRDLAARVAIQNPRRVIDLGCGTGNSTEVLAARWPRAELTGLDSSAEMIAKARSAHPEWRCCVGDIAEWTNSEDCFDVVFSNAAMQWVPDHPRLFPRLMSHVAPGGALAVQMPDNYDAEAHRLMRAVASRFPATDSVREWFTHGTGFYYDSLAPLSSRIDLWSTEYIHVMEGPENIVEWYKGSGMRPFLDALPTDTGRERFTADYLVAIREAYPARQDDRVLFPFRRLFIIAYVHGGPLA